MIAAIAILYEDERGKVKHFPLHTLVCACVADAVGCGVEVIEPLLNALPMKGDSKLLAACKADIPDMRERDIFALFDADKLHRLLNQAGDTPLPVLLDLLRSKIPDPRAKIFLLERNTETLVFAAADCLERDPPPTKNKVDRDKLLASAAWDPSRSSRDCIRDKVPTFAEFIDALVPLVQSAITA
jgi:hypothetical protein